MAGLLLLYTVPPLIGSRIVESAAYCNQKLLTLLYLKKSQITSVNWIIRLLLSLLSCPKVIVLSCGHCVTVKYALNQGNTTYVNEISCLLKTKFIFNVDSWFSQQTPLQQAELSMIRSRIAKKAWTNLFKFWFSNFKYQNRILNLAEFDYIGKFDVRPF